MSTLPKIMYLEHLHTWYPSNFEEEDIVPEAVVLWMVVSHYTCAGK